MTDISREQTLGLLEEFVKTDTLMKHLLGVEAAMKAYARKYGEDEGRWGLAGLLHDFDWESVPTPEDHPSYGARILEDRGYPDDIIRAVMSHGDHTGVKRGRGTCQAAAFGPLIEWWPTPASSPPLACVL